MKTHLIDNQVKTTTYCGTCYMDLAGDIVVNTTDVVENVTCKRCMRRWEAEQDLPSVGDVFEHPTRGYHRKVVSVRHSTRRIRWERVDFIRGGRRRGNCTFTAWREWAMFATKRVPLFKFEV